MPSVTNLFRLAAIYKAAPYELFHHLQFSARRERDKREQLLKFNLLPLALEIIRKSGTIQEYRKLLTPIGKPRSWRFCTRTGLKPWCLLFEACLPGCFGWRRKKKQTDGQNTSQQRAIFDSRKVGVCLGVLRLGRR
jgi:hypothetical protein